MSGELPYPYSVKRHGVTVTNCDSEPVQTPGCVQSHGVLLAARPEDLTILQVSENSAAWLGEEASALLGRDAGEVLGRSEAERLRQLVAGRVLERNPLYACTVSPLGTPLDVTVHTLDGLLLIELEATDRTSGPGDADYYRLVKRATARLQAAESLADFCQAAAEEVRDATALDRVMVYRFDGDGSGEVLAEARRPDLHSWLGLRYPAEDIPKPAREIFKRIGVRPLPDARAEQFEMVPLVNPDTGRPLDMTHCALRGASVMYTEYVLNIGVAATLTMPLLRDGDLWGLFACHHETPARFPYPLRAAAELLAQIASLQLPKAEEREHLEYRSRIEAVHHELLAKVARDGELAALTGEASPLLEGIAAGGVALYHRDRWWTLGRTPAEPELEALADWLRALPEMSDPTRPVFATDSLSARWPQAAGFAAVASGVLAVPFSRGQRNLMMWLRPERVQTFNWAGNPYDKPTVVGPHGPRLTPRTSFELWQENVRGRSVPWLPMEVESALKLRYLVMDLVVSRAEQLAALNADLARSNEELDAFAYVASHDLKEPLRGIHKYAYYLLEEAQTGAAFGERSRERLEGLMRLALRMDGLLDSLLHFSRVGRLRLDYEEMSLESVLQEALDMLGARLEESGAEIVVPRPLPQVECDRVRTREILTNLLSNSIKYNESPQKRVEVGYFEPGETAPDFHEPALAPEEAAGQRIFYVRDNGIGIEARHFEQIFKMFKRLHAREAYGGGSGAGLTITRKLVEQHGGRIWVSSRPGAGTGFFFTLPRGNGTRGGGGS